ncbi:MAG: hypothetical protein IRZ06_05720 [Nevskia sp.]|nr:hypothetical protein [Nevskia sp.]
MNRILRLFSPLLPVLLLACSSPATRIEQNPALFDSYPPEVQQKIRAGQVDVGFTPDMVRLALGEPDRRYERTDANGTSEVWAYRERKPAFSFGIGGGSFGGSSAVGGGVGVATGGEQGEKLRVVFVDGKVTAVEKTLP